MRWDKEDGDEMDRFLVTVCVSLVLIIATSSPLNNETKFFLVYTLSKFDRCCFGYPYR